MSTYQRRRGIPATFYPVVKRTDTLGNIHKIADEDNPLEVKVWIFPQRSAKAEVAGQQHINVTRLGVRADLEGVELWSQIDFMGKKWDVVQPPAYHHGTRHTRHWSIDIRERP